MLYKVIITLFILLHPVYCYSDIIPNDREITWSAGISGGVPTNYTLCANVKNSPYNAVGDDTTDDTSAFTSALAACSTGTYVYVPSGIYKITSGLNIPSGVMIKGDGPTVSVIRDHRVAGTGNYILQITGSSSSQVSNITAGWSKDSTSITVDSTTGIAVNDYVMMSQLNETGLVTATGYGSPCTWCGPRDNETRAMAQIVKIIGINGLILTINRPVYYASSGYSPQVMQLGGSLRIGSGIQDLKVERVNTVSSSHNNIVVQFCINCWIKNVESYMTGGAHIRAQYNYGCEIRDSYLHEAWGYGSGAGYGILMLHPNSDNLIENNIFYLTRHTVVFEGGGSGNVVAYNYGKDALDSDSTTWLTGDYLTHGAHPHMNLFEGNVGQHFELDNTWGSSSHNTFLRNYSSRTRTQTTSIGQRAFEIEENNQFENFVGNVLGPTSGGGTEGPGTLCETNPVDWRTLGCRTPGSSGTPVNDNVSDDILRHGNYSYAGAQIQWDGSIADHVIPDSYYLGAKPSWYGNCVWPPIEPTTGVVNSIPAKLRYEGTSCTCTDCGSLLRRIINLRYRSK